MSEREQLDLEVLLLQEISLLWELPWMNNEQVPLALGIGQTTWQALKRGGIAPPCVWIGDRPFYRPADLRKWIDEMEAKKNPGECAGVSVEQ